MEYFYAVDKAPMVSQVFASELLTTNRQNTTFFALGIKSITISTSKPSASNGSHGIVGEYGGGDGSPGENGSDGEAAERNIVGVCTDGISLQISNVVPPVPENIEYHPSCVIHTSSFPLINQTRCALYALGGQGGWGGWGGNGGTGYRGRNGINATQFSSGTDGGK